jgi:hypothetical protein
VVCGCGWLVVGLGVKKVGSGFLKPCKFTSKLCSQNMGVEVMIGSVFAGLLLQGGLYGCTGDIGGRWGSEMWQMEERERVGVVV